LGSIWPRLSNSSGGTQFGSPA